MSQHSKSDIKSFSAKTAAVTTRKGILQKPITRAYIHSLRGSLKGKGVMKALMEDRKTRARTVTIGARTLMSAWIK